MDISKIKKILITRTDRIGDVVLSLPVVTATRKAFPGTYIAMMVAPKGAEILADNPYLDEIIVYDKKIKHRGIFQTLNFAKWLRTKKFDLAIILHTTVRVNLVCFLSGIPKRVGYKRGKMDFLLTDGMEYKKRFGEKHESEYSLDVLRFIGVKAEFSMPEIFINDSDAKKIDGMFRDLGIGQDEKVVLIHPGASCLSKMWPLENFANLGDTLIRDFKAKVLIFIGPEHIKIGERVRALMKGNVIFLRNPPTLGETVALFKKVDLVISNDSGPIHIASSVGTPVIAILGRNQKGLGPTRWGPLGDKSIVLHKDVGCEECLAHNCKKGFLCLKAISVEEVVEKARPFL